MKFLIILLSDKINQRKVWYFAELSLSLHYIKTNNNENYKQITGKRSKAIK